MPTSLAPLLATCITLLLLALPARALTEQVAEVSTGFWDGVSQPSFCRIDETDPAFAEVECVGTDASPRTIYVNGQATEVVSAGSSVVMARATPGSLGASAYNGWIVGYDNYYGYADSRTADDVVITGGTPNGTATIAVGAVVNGGLGIYGSDAAASARAYFRFVGGSLSSGTASVFEDRAHGEEAFDGMGNPLPPVHVYDFGVRHDVRYVDIALDANGEGTLNVELRLEVSAFEEGDENLYESAAAADYGNTIDAYLQPWSSDFTILSGWEVRAFGQAFSVSPEPIVLTPEQLGLVPEPAPILLLPAGLALLARRRGRSAA